MSLINGETAKDKQETLHISLLGKFSLHVGKTAVSLDTPRYQSLLAFLVLHPQQAHFRQELAFKFWPDSSESQARTNLRKALYTIRQTLPQADCFISAERQHVQWRLDAPCRVDVWQFETAVSQSEKATPFVRQTCLEQAISAYQGDFLPDHYEDWVLTYREKLRHQYLTILETLLALHETQRHYPEAIRLAQTLLREDPLHEAAYRRMMRLQSLDGNVAGALRTYHTCSTKLHRELGVPPSRATQEAYERLLKLKTSRQTPQPARVPLTAREEVWTQLQTVWQRACREQPQVVLLAGEAGIGKTRMAEELLDWTQRQGITTVTAVCYATEGQLPYSPIADWLRSDAFEDVLEVVPDKWLIECARLLPEILARREALPSPEPLREGWQQQHFFAALAHTILTAKRPLLLFIDDLHWCDRDTLDWLHFLLRFDRQARFLLMGTIRTEEVTPDHPLIPWQQFLEREDTLTTLPLTRLNIEETTQLASHLCQHPLNQEQASRLYAETEGVPLFVVEMANAGLPKLQIGENLSTIQLPPKVQTAIEFRLSQLSSEARELANLAAVIGRSFTFELLTAVDGQDEETIVCGLDELWQRRIVREQGLNAYDFSHDKIRQTVYANLSSARRRFLHSRIIHALRKLYSEDLDKVSSQLAVHYEAAQQFEDAIHFYQRAAVVSNRVFAHQETIQYLHRAIARLPQVTISAQQQAEIYELLGDILALTGKPALAQEMFETAVFVVQDAIWQSRLYRKIANTWQVRTSYQEAFQAFLIAESKLDDLIDVDETRTIAKWQEWLWIQLDLLWVLYSENRDGEMARLAEQMQATLDKFGLSIQRGLYFQYLMLLGFRRERYVLSQQTINHAQASLNAIEQNGTMSQIAFARFNLGMAYLWYGWHGKLEDAEFHMKIAQTEAEEIGDVVLQSRIFTYLTLIYRRRREIDKVRDYLLRSMCVAKQAGMEQYIAQTQANEAWLAWFEGDLEKTQKMGRAALERLRSCSFAVPFWGMALWPLMGACVIQDVIESAITYAHYLLDPSQARMHDEITAVLQQAISAWENKQADVSRTKLKQALKLAQTYQYL